MRPDGAVACVIFPRRAVLFAAPQTRRWLSLPNRGCPAKRRCESALRVLSLVLGLLWQTTMADNRLDRVGRLWTPDIEWSLENPTFQGNPYDLIASATFVHVPSGVQRTTGMFYDGGSVWKFRFTGTRLGAWSFTTRSADPDLDGQRGTVSVRGDIGASGTGFITSLAGKWARPVGRPGRLQAFVPQLVMYAGPRDFHGRPARIDADIETFLVEHGFNGFHVMGSCHWFDIDQRGSHEIKQTNPDRRTFEALELLIRKVHVAGGMVHLWMWGDESRRWTPHRWGLNGRVDQRLQRYLAARLGPLPGWTMGYGFDLDEWVVARDLEVWQRHLQEQFGWSHLLGARDAGPNRGLDHRRNQIYEGLGYAGYEHHRPTFEVYRAAVTARPARPVFSEDRFRIRHSREYAEKDYTMELTRRGLWHSTMAGGVANIWGHFPPGRDAWQGSARYEKPQMIKTYRRFFARRFRNAMRPAAQGMCLQVPAGTHYVFYAEDAGTVTLDLTAMPGAQPAVAVDTLRPYQELPLGRLTATETNWRAPYRSDWAIAVGVFK